MNKNDMKHVSLINWQTYDKDNFYFIFLDYNEGYDVIINRKYTNELINICINEGCFILNDKSHLNTYKDLDKFTKLLKKHNIEYNTKWFDIEY